MFLLLINVNQKDELIFFIFLNKGVVLLISLKLITVYCNNPEDIGTRSSSNYFRDII